MNEKVIAEARMQFPLPGFADPESVYKSIYRIVRTDEGYQLRVTVDVPEDVAREMHRRLVPLGHGIPADDAFGTSRREGA